MNSFVISFTPLSGDAKTDLWFIFHGDRLLIKPDGDIPCIPNWEDAACLNQHIIRSQYIGALEGLNCYTAELESHPSDLRGMEFQELRPLFSVLDEDIFRIAGRAFQIIDWERTHQFCGRCGYRTTPKTGERAKECPQCGLAVYPAMAPAVIVAVVRGREILLAQSPRFRNSFYSVLAGFVEPGETFEDAVRREVREETGIEVKNIRYFGSQPWPFPNSLMVGFTADYDSGEIRIDKSEIEDARWFACDNLPPVPRTGTIARRLIDFFHGVP